MLQGAIAAKRSAEGQVDWEALRHRAHAIKAYTMDHLDRLLVQFEAAFQARGGTILWAASREDAVAHVTSICRRHDVTSVVKGKSMLSEELELNAHLERSGIAA
ncbi:MAG: LUD domain-containing protein, partial [Candidatus Eremiobacteraeota bacterium]|nr:LUD domain-containing protein [Candidatus Eremiobacteraeota bacterium]